jgi:hypothetical protein
MQRARLLFALDALSRKVIRRVLQGSEEAQSTPQCQRWSPQARHAADARQYDAATELHPHARCSGLDCRPKDPKNVVNTRVELATLALLAPRSNQLS